MPDFREKCEFPDTVAVKKTAKALICLISDEKFIVPDSQIDDSSEIWEEEQEGTLIVSSWWARKAGIEP